MFEGAEGVSLWNVVRNEQPAKALQSVVRHQPNRALGKNVIHITLIALVLLSHFSSDIYLQKAIGIIDGRLPALPQTILRPTACTVFAGFIRRLPGVWESGVTLDMWHIYLAAKRCTFNSLPALFLRG